MCLLKLDPQAAAVWICTERLSLLPLSMPWGSGLFKKPFSELAVLWDLQGQVTRASSCKNQGPRPGSALPEILVNWSEAERERKDRIRRPPLSDSIFIGYW